MMFILMFVAAVLLVPVLSDIQKHGADNILRRSANDLLQLRPVRATTSVFGELESALMTGATLSAVMLLILWVLSKLLEALLR